MGEPTFNRKRRYVNKKGQKFGKGVWFDDKGNLIKPGQGFNVGTKENPIIKQYNTDGTTTLFNARDWHFKKQREHELNVLRNDRKWGIPYIPEKKLTISIDKNSPTHGNRGVTISENVLDSIAVNAKRAGIPFSTGLAIASTESKLGTHKERKLGESLLPWLDDIYLWKSKEANAGDKISYRNTYSPTLMVSNWRQKTNHPFSAFEYDSNLHSFDDGKGRSSQYYKDNFIPALQRSNKYTFDNESPLQNAFEFYKKNPDKFNPNDKTYLNKVEANRRELVNYSPEIKAYMKKHNLYGDGGELKEDWDTLSLADKAEMMKVAINNGIVSLPEIREAYNEFAKGGYKPSGKIQKDIATWEGSEMKRNVPFAEMARQFNAVVPLEIQEKLNANQLDALYSYGYNVGMGNLKKRVLPILTAYTQGKASNEDVQRAMWASRDSQLRGLTRRRNWERELFGGDYRTTFDNNKIGVQIDSSRYALPERFFQDYSQQINNIQIPQGELMVDPSTLYKPPVVDESLLQRTEPNEETVMYNPRQEKKEKWQQIGNILGIMGMEDPLTGMNSGEGMGLMDIANFVYGGKGM